MLGLNMNWILLSSLPHVLRKAVMGLTESFREIGRNRSDSILHNMFQKSGVTV